MATKKLEVLITGNSRGAQKAFADTERSASTFGSKLGGVGKKVGGAMALGLGGLATGVALMGPQLFDLQGKLQAWALKTDTVFEGSAAAVKKWADANNEAFGVTDEELAGLAAGFGDLLKPMGFTAQQASEMSMDVVGLSGALSEWSGGTRSAAEVSEILAKAMLGERDSLKELGISITEADVQTRLAAKGQDKLTGAALEQAKALATQELIFEKSTDAQKAYAKGGNETIRAGNKLKAIWGEVQVFLAERLVPILAKVAGWLGDNLPKAGAKIRDLFEEIQPTLDKMRDGFQAIADKLRPVAEAIGRFVKDNPGPVFAGLAVVVGVLLAGAFWSLATAVLAALSPVVLIVAAVALLAAGLVWAYQNVDWFRSAVQTMASFVTETVIPAVKTLWSWFAENILPVLQVVAAFITREVIAALAVLWGFISETVIPKLKEFWETVGTGIDKMEDFALSIAEDVIPALESLESKVREDALPALSGFAIWVNTRGTPILSAFARFVSAQLAGAFRIAASAVGALARVMGSVLSNSAAVARMGISNLISILGPLVSLSAATARAIGTVMAMGFRNLKAAIDPVLSAARTTAEAIQRIVNLASKIPTSLPGIGGLIGKLPGFASGGTPPVGTPYIVGENGPEIRIDKRPGVIIPNDKLTVPSAGRSVSLASGGSGGDTVVVQIHVEGSVLTERKLVEVVRDGMIDLGRRTGRPVLAGLA